MFKALFVLEILKYLSAFFGYVEKSFDKMAFTSKFMSQTGQQIITIH